MRTPRLAVLATFAAFGVALGAWAGASAFVIARAGVGATGFGCALTLMTIVYLAAMTGAGAVTARFGVRNTLLICLLTLGPVLALVLASRSAPWFFAALALQGAVAGLLDSAMNAEGARVEHRSPKPVFVQFHAMASAGGAAGALIGGYLAYYGAIWVAAFVAEAALLAAAVIVHSAIKDPTLEAPPPDLATPRTVDFGLAVLGLAVGVSIVVESSAMSWSALLLKQTAPSLAAYAGLGATFFGAFQSAMRFRIDRLRRSFSDRTLILISYAAATIGLLIVGADRSFLLTAAGFAVIGVGTGAIVPCGFALAARRSSASAGAAISAVAFFGLFPRTPAPLLTGVVADAFSLPVAFFCLAGLMLIAMLAVAVFVPSTAIAKSSPKLAREGLAHEI